MKNKRTTAFIYTLLHFFVDFTTIFLIAKVLLGPKIGMVNRGHVIIVYNLIAFAGQLPMGMIADILNKNHTFAAFGCVCSATAYPASFISPWLGCILASVGNGAFHIGGGKEILDMSMPKAGIPGLFVSSGALGVWCAYQFNSMAFIWLCPIIMFIAGLMILFTHKTTQTNTPSVVLKYNKSNFIILTAVICFMLTIVIRSLLGSVITFTWKSTPILSFLFVLAVAAGKASGGFLGDRFGTIKTAVISLSVSFISFAFAFDFWPAGIIGVLCFNMTMPLTLTAIAGVCNKKHGFAFGMTTFALALGFIPTVFGAKAWFSLPMLAICICASLVLLVAGYCLMKNKTDKGGI